MTVISTQPTLDAWIDRHRETLDAAMAALRHRGHWSAYPESPRAPGEEARRAGSEKFESHLGTRFPLDGPGVDGWVGEERSPYGLELGIQYPHVPPEDLLAAARAGSSSWRAATPRARAAVCAEVLDRLHARSTEIAYAVMHTTGQPFLMAFQAGGPHAQDRGLEAVAAALAEQQRIAERAVWEKPGRQGRLVRMEKDSVPVARGVTLVVGCNTFPTWNSYPGLFASLACGNAVVVKPHRRAVLPLAITVSVIREVLAEAGFSPDVATLAAEREDERLASTLAVDPAVRVVDFTGSSQFGVWLERHATQARVYTEKSGVNTVLLHSTDDYAGLVSNLALSLSLYSGQMCTTPQDLIVPAQGIQTDQGPRSVADLAHDLRAALGQLLGDDARAVEVLGAIVSDEVLHRLEAAATRGPVLVPSRTVVHPAFPAARVRTPLVVGSTPDDPAIAEEAFGPISYLVTVPDFACGVELFTRLGHEKGALTAAVHSTDPRVLDLVRAAALDVGVSLSENLTGEVLVNQTAAFSDLHGTGANPAANAAYSDADFISGRFRVVQLRRPLPQEEE